MVLLFAIQKYNKCGEILLNILSVNNEDAVGSADGSRSSSRKPMKENKDECCAKDSGDGSIFNSHRYTINSQMQMVEINQFHDAHKMEVIKNTLDHLTNWNKLLLEERQQQIN